ncbi:MAG TPA: FixH family protein [Ohtaekwangia sp.]
MNWGKSIILAFVLFAAFIATLVTVCVRQDVSLVSKEYYAEELVYQEQIARLENTNTLEQKPEISIDQNKHLQITFNRFDQVEKGELILFCPSDSRQDKKVKVTSSQQPVQIIPVNLAPGMYKARFTWSMNEKEYYIEKVIQL